MKKILFIATLICLVFSQRSVSPEAKVFSKTKNGVFTVFGKSGSGSGFLIHEYGLILTNDHVIGDDDEYDLSVKLNNSTRIEAKLIKRDISKDLALIGINPNAVKELNLKPLKIASKSDTMIYVGERVIAIGSPLNQEKILTSGIISKLETGLVIHDVNINPGNSGGPLINMNGEVIAVNSFGDFSSRGPGIYGSVNILEAKNLIGKAIKIINSPNFSLYDLSLKKLPVMPDNIFPTEQLTKTVNDKFHAQDYQLKAGKYKLNFYTPTYVNHLRNKDNIRLGNKRESSSETNPSSNYIAKIYDWQGSVDDFLKPVIFLEISPIIGQTTGSAVGNTLMAVAAGYSGTSGYYNYNYEFKSDVKKVRIMKGEEEIKSIMANYDIITIDFESRGYTYTQKGEDMAQRATLTLRIDDFLPNKNGDFENYTIEIEDYKTSKTSQWIIPKNTIYKINKDFEEYTKNYSGGKSYIEPSSGCS